VELAQISIKKVVWDDLNIAHIAKHGVKPSDVDFAFSDARAVFFKTYSERIIVLGRSGKRLLAVVLSREKEGCYYVVTARDMAKKERTIYRKGV